jgi:hypothetical protein
VIYVHCATNNLANANCFKPINSNNTTIMALKLPLDFKGDVLVPKPGQPLHDVVSRWSDTHISHPAIVFRPNTEADIKSALSYAKQHNLTVLVAVGGHGANVPVTSKTLYLDLRAFSSVELDKGSGTVRVDGGALSGEVISTLTSAGYYTSWPNSNAVGYVGYVMGGGSGTVNGMHGFGVDNAVSFEVITANGEKVSVSAGSKERERELFNVLCGAGFGLVVVTAVVMRVFPIAALKLTDVDRLVVRRLMFTPTKIETVAKAFTSMQASIPAKCIATMIAMRSPPNAPNPGSPLIMLTATWYGTAAELEAALPALFNQDLTSASFNAATDLLPFAEQNTALKPFSAHGDHKEFSSVLLPNISAQSIEKAFELWLDVTDKHADAKPTTLVFNIWDNAALLEHGRSEVGRAKAFAAENREARAFASAIKWSSSTESRPALDVFGDLFLHAVQDSGSGPANGATRGRTIPGNMRLKMDLAEVFGAEKVEFIRKLKKDWDPEGLFWSPDFV